MTKPPPELLEFLHPYGSAIQSIALGLRTVVLDEMAPCHEYIYQMGAKKLSLLYGGSEKVIRDNVCAIIPFAKHVNLGFSHGADLKDASKVLQGTGKAWRHIPIRELSDLDRPEIRAYVREARRLAGLERPPKQSAAARIITRVKRSSPARTKRKQSWPELF